MLLYQFVRSVESFYDELRRQQGFTRILNEIIAAHAEITSEVFDKVKAGDLEGASKQYTEGLQTAKAIVGNIKPRHFFVNVETIDDSISTFFGESFNSSGMFKNGTFIKRGGDFDETYDLKKQLAELSDSYEKYLFANGDKKAEMIAFCGSGVQFNNSLNLIRNLLEHIKCNLYGEEPQAKEAQRISILLESEHSLNVFAGKLTALNTVYDELCHLVNVSLTEYPIKIIKIESGSFWTDLLGYPKIIALMESLIKNAISYIYRNFTTEGKIVAIPKKVEAIDSIIELRRKLREEGVDETGLDEHINKSSVIIAKELNKLLSGEPKVTINEQVFSVSQELEQKFLSESRQLSISDKSEEVITEGDRIG